jgi:TPR repeat protein
VVQEGACYCCCCIRSWQSSCSQHAYNIFDVQAADKNNLESIHALALMEAAGRGVEMNMKSAIKKFIKLAALDLDPPYPNAHYMLGLLALKGHIVNKLPLSKILPEQYATSYHEIISSGGDGSSDKVDKDGNKVAGGGVDKRMKDFVLGVKLIRYASELGHPQATDQLKQLLESLDEVGTPDLLSGEL